MTMGGIALCFAVSIGSLAMGRAQNAGISARISSMPPASLQDVASLEARVRANPEDLASRVELLNGAPVEVATEITVKFPGN